MTFELYVRDPVDKLADDLRLDLLEQSGAVCPTCGASWDPFELAEERAAGNDELWHDCLTEEAT